MIHYWAWMAFCDCGDFPQIRTVRWARGPAVGQVSSRYEVILAKVGNMTAMFPVIRLFTPDKFGGSLGLLHSKSLERIFTGVVDGPRPLVSLVLGLGS